VGLPSPALQQRWAPNRPAPAAALDDTTANNGPPRPTSLQPLTQSRWPGVETEQPGESIGLLRRLTPSCPSLATREPRPAQAWCSLASCPWSQAARAPWSMVARDEGCRWVAPCGCIIWLGNHLFDLRFDVPSKVPSCGFAAKKKPAPPRPRPRPDCSRRRDSMYTTTP
jgi:hypothetical protein